MGIGMRVGSRQITSKGLTENGVVTYESNTACAFWDYPSDAQISGVCVRYSTSGYPADETSGNLFYEGAGTLQVIDINTSKIGARVGGFTAGTTYYFTFIPYVLNSGVKAYKRNIIKTSSWTSTSVSGSRSFTQAGTLTIPSGVRSIYVQAVGAGGSGGNGAWLSWSDPSHRASGGGGGGGGYIARNSISVIPGQSVSVGVGSGATTVTANGSTVTASKGGDGASATCYASSTNGGNGGAGASGGGGGNVDTGWHYQTKTAGGVNGGNGTSGAGGGSSGVNAGAGGSGNGTNCYINGTLFSTGGAGGTACAYNTLHDDAVAGGANTGNGGGGGWGDYSALGYGAGGGTGFCLITW